MSDDLIRRSDAIEAIEVVDWYHQNRNKDMVSGANSDEHQAWYKADDVYKALEAVPSADRPSIDIVRCAECKWGKPYSDKQLECDALGLGGLKFPNDFCSYGERKYQ